MNYGYDKITVSDACDLIALWLKSTLKIDVEPKAIWSMAPVGELCYIKGLYELARIWQMEAG